MPGEQNFNQWQSGGESGVESSPVEIEGGVEMPKSKRYRSRVFVGYDDNGEKRYITPSAYTKKELAAKVKQIKEEYKSSIQAQKPVSVGTSSAKEEKPMSPQFRDYALSWYRLYREPGIEKATKDMYNNVFKNHLFPEFGDTPIADIRPDDLQMFIIQYDEMSHSLISKIAMTLKAVFKNALYDDIIAKNPTERMKPPEGTRGERKPLTMEEVKALVEQAQGHPDGFLPMLLLFTGLRRGEAMGLRWEDIYDGRIHVERAAYFDENNTILKDTKTKAARRSIPISDAIADRLSKTGEGYVFGGDTLWTKSKYRRTWERLVESMPILKKASAHVLRHTYTMLLRRANVDSVTAQYLLGHEDYSTTANIYTHIGKDDLAEAIQKMGNLLPQILPQGAVRK